MQFHLNGFEPGDPEIADPAERIRPSGTAGSVPAEVDVLIVGCGPAGLTLAAQLAAFPDIKTCIVEQKPGRLSRGQADGVACRTMEMFDAFGFSDRVLKEACWINETTFWKPDGTRLITSCAAAGSGCRGRAVGIAACDPQPGARARFLSRGHAQIAREARAVLFATPARSLIAPAAPFEDHA